MLYTGVWAVDIGDLLLVMLNLCLVKEYHELESYYGTYFTNSVLADAI